MFVGNVGRIYESLDMFRILMFIGLSPPQQESKKGTERDQKLALIDYECQFGSNCM